MGRKRSYSGFSSENSSSTFSSGDFSGLSKGCSGSSSSQLSGVCSFFSGKRFIISTESQPSGSDSNERDLSNASQNSANCSNPIRNDERSLHEYFSEFKYDDCGDVQPVTHDDDENDSLEESGDFDTGSLPLKYFQPKVNQFFETSTVTVTSPDNITAKGGCATICSGQKVLSNLSSREKQKYVDKATADAEISLVSDSCFQPQLERFFKSSKPRISKNKKTDSENSDKRHSSTFATNTADSGSEKQFKTFKHPEIDKKKVRNSISARNSSKYKKPSTNFGNKFQNASGENKMRTQSNPFEKSSKNFDLRPFYQSLDVNMKSVRTKLASTETTAHNSKENSAMEGYLKTRKPPLENISDMKNNLVDVFTDIFPKPNKSQSNQQKNKHISYPGLPLLNTSSRKSNDATVSVDFNNDTALGEPIQLNDCWERKFNSTGGLNGIQKFNSVENVRTISSDSVLSANIQENANGCNDVNFSSQNSSHFNVSEVLNFSPPKTTVALQLEQLYKTTNDNGKNSFLSPEIDDTPTFKGFKVQPSRTSTPISVQNSELYSRNENIGGGTNKDIEEKQCKQSDFIFSSQQTFSDSQKSIFRELNDHRGTNVQDVVAVCVKDSNKGILSPAANDSLNASDESYVFSALSENIQEKANGCNDVYFSSQSSRHCNVSEVLNCSPPKTTMTLQFEQLYKTINDNCKNSFLHSEIDDSPTFKGFKVQPLRTSTPVPVQNSEMYSRNENIEGGTNKDIEEKQCKQSDFIFSSQQTFLDSQKSIFKELNNNRGTIVQDVVAVCAKDSDRGILSPAANDSLNASDESYVFGVLSKNIQEKANGCNDVYFSNQSSRDCNVSEVLNCSPPKTTMTLQFEQLYKTINDNCKNSFLHPEIDDSPTFKGFKVQPSRTSTPIHVQNSELYSRNANIEGGTHKEIEEKQFKQSDFIFSSQQTFPDSQKSIFRELNDNRGTIVQDVVVPRVKDSNKGILSPTSNDSLNASDESYVFLREIAMEEPNASLHSSVVKDDDCAISLGPDDVRLQSDTGETNVNASSSKVSRASFEVNWSAKLDDINNHQSNVFEKKQLNSSNAEIDQIWSPLNISLFSNPVERLKHLENCSENLVIHGGGNTSFILNDLSSGKKQLNSSDAEIDQICSPLNISLFSNPDELLKHLENCSENLVIYGGGNTSPILNDLFSEKKQLNSRDAEIDQICSPLNMSLFSNPVERLKNLENCSENLVTYGGRNTSPIMNDLLSSNIPLSYASVRDLAGELTGNKSLRSSQLSLFNSESLLDATGKYNAPLEKISSNCNRDKIHINSQFSEKADVKTRENHFGGDTNIIVSSRHTPDVMRLNALDSSGWETLSTGSRDNFNDVDKRLREGMNRITRDKSLIYAGPKGPSVWQNQQKTNFLKIIIPQIFQELIVNAQAGKQLEFTVRKGDNWKNCKFENEMLKVKCEGNPSVVRFVHNRYARFNVMVFLLGKIYALLMENSICTQREVYYQYLNYLNSQKQIRDGIDLISAMLRVEPWYFPIVSTSKGLVFGDLTIVISPTQITRCNSFGGTLIPQDVTKIKEVKSKAFFILVVEKDAIFKKLLDEDIPNKFTRPFIMITGKGCPDINTRLFLKLLWVQLRIPVFILVDGDPHGIEIMLTYRFGSASLAHLSDHLALPKIRWLGIHPSEIVTLNITHQPLIDKERRKVELMLTRPYVAANAWLKRELEVLLERNFKAGIEGVIKNNSYLTDFYLANKFYSQEYF